MARIRLLAKKTGFSGVDVAIAPAMEHGVGRTKKQLELEPAVLAMPAEFRKDQGTFDADFAKLEKAAQFAAAIGCPSNKLPMF